MKRAYLQTEEERVRQLRLNLLVHSYIYYQLNTNIISDHQWQAMANELVERQKTFTRRIGCYDQAFRDWDASTGYHLPVDDWVRSKALYLLRLVGQAQEPPVTIQRRPIKPIRRGLLDL